MGTKMWCSNLRAYFLLIRLFKPEVSLSKKMILIWLLWASIKQTEIIQAFFDKTKIKKTQIILQFIQTTP